MARKKRSQSIKKTTSANVGFEEKLWAAADKMRNNMRNNMDPAEYKHIVLGLNKTTTSLFEFFYWYRIKANYRDLEFISKGVADSQFKKFYLNYLLFMSNVCEALKGCINNLSEIRFKEKLF